MEVLWLCQVCTLPALVSLDVRSNELESVPSLGGLASLEVLLLDDNHLHALPPDLAGLPALHELGIAENLFRTLPEVVLKCTSLNQAPPL